jgi:transglutaminase-like putative cysteine protease
VSTVVERQRWLGVLALVVAVPLPLTGIVSWPFLLPFLAIAAWVVASRRPLAPLPVWLENVLAPAILLAVVGAGGVRFGVLRPVAQLAVLVAAVRLPGCGRRGRSTTTGGVLALVGVAGIASSTHPTLALYLVGLLVFVVLAVGRLTGVAAAEAASADGQAVGWPPARLITATVLTSVVVAAPLFVVLPRLRSPFAAAPFAVSPLAGFRDAVMLNGIGEVKESRRLVMRVRFPGTEAGHVSPDWLRLAGATMTHYRAGGWVEGRLRGERVVASPDAPVALAPRAAGSVVRHAEITLETRGRSVFLPVGALSLTMESPVALTREPSGAMRLPRGSEAPIAYSVRFDPARVEQPAPGEQDLELPARSDDLHALAEEMSGRTTNHLAAALAIQQGLQERCRYTLQTYAPLREDPVRWFLFRSRAGHCEFFASSMVLLLRTLGIPARLQAGFAGGEPDGDGGFLVRDSHAHAWVVAYLEGRWRVFDPTPPEGRPGISVASGESVLRLGWQQLESSWDRWILTFSMADQVELARQALDSITAVHLSAPVVALVAGGVAALALLMRRRRRTRPRPAPADRRRVPYLTRTLQSVMQSAASRGIPVSPSMTAREFGEAVSAARPAAREPIVWLVGQHERVRYAGNAAPARRDLRRARRAAERSLTAR